MRPLPSLKAGWIDTGVPDTSCKISGRCQVLPSENPEKIRQVLSNILPYAGIKIGKDSARATARGLDSLEKIFDAIHSRKTQRAYLRHMRKNLDDTSTWFYLNKQAAFADNIALCEREDESPMGPVKITLESDRIEQVMQWLAGE